MRPIILEKFSMRTAVFSVFLSAGLGLTACSTDTAVMVERNLLGRATIKAARSIQNDFQFKKDTRMTIRPLDPQAKDALEYLTLSAAFAKTLSGAGYAVSEDKPEILFLLGYALELGTQDPWDRNLVIYGYRISTGQRIYQAKITSSGRMASVFEIGDGVFESLVRDIPSTGAIRDVITVGHPTRS